LDDLSGGRMILGMGGGVPAVVKQMANYFSPLTMLRDTAYVVRELYSKGTVNFEGKGFKAQNVTLGGCSYLEPLGTFKPGRKSIPIYFGSMGPKMLDLAGEVADGLLISVGYSTGQAKDAIALAKAGAAKVGKNVENFDVAGLVPASASKDGSVDDATKGMVATMIAVFFNDEALERGGFSPSDVAPLRQAFAKGGWMEASSFVTSKMLETYAATGKKDQIVDRLIEYEKAGVKIPLLFAMGCDLDLLLEAGKTYIHST
jgi:5,10-methylenetetrahydromethanopterin reductase